MSKSILLKQIQNLLLDNTIRVPFHFEKDIVFHKHFFLDFHPNGIDVQSHFERQYQVMNLIFYSIGGGCSLKVRNKKMKVKRYRI